MRANILSEPDETDALVSTLMSDPEAEGMIEGDELIVGNLTPVQASGTSGSATWASASDATLNWIAGLGELTPGWAASFGQVDDARRRLLGIPRSVDQLQASIDSWASQNNIDLTTYQVEARFGAYGALPVIVGVYTNSPDSGFILVDGVNGNIDGPFESATIIDANALLAGHSNAYISGTPVNIADPSTGECIPVAKSWSPIAPPGYTPRGPCAACPVGPAWTPPGPYIFPFLPSPAPSITPQPNTPGWQGTPKCATTGSGCTCVSYGHAAGPPGKPLIPIRIKCISAGPCPSPTSLNPAAPGCITEYYN